MSMFKVTQKVSVETSTLTVKEISTIKDKFQVLHWDNKWEKLSSRQNCTQAKLRLVKCKFIHQVKALTENALKGLPAWRQTAWAAFAKVKSPKPTETTPTVAEGIQPTPWVDIRTWQHCLEGFSGMQEIQDHGVLHQGSRKLQRPKVCGRIRSPTRKSWC